MIDPITLPSTVAIAYEVIKIWIPIGGFFFGAFKVYNWVKDSLTGIKEDVKGLRTEIASQTLSFTNEMKESRADFRTFFIPLLTAVNAQTASRPVRAKRTKKAVTVDKR